MPAKKPSAKTKPAGLAWTKAQRAALRGVRRPHPYDPPPVPTTAEEGWKAFLACVPEQEKLYGAVKCEEQNAERLFEPIRVSIQSGTPPATFDTIAEQVRTMLMIGKSTADDDPTDGLQGLVAFWCNAFGFEKLCALARAAHNYSIASWQQGDQSGRLFQGRDWSDSSPQRGLGILEHDQFRIALRRYFFALSEEQFAVQSAAFKRACLASASLRDSQWIDPEKEAVFVAYVLGRDSSHAHALVRKEKDGSIAYVPQTGWLLASMTDLSLAKEVVASLARVMIFGGASCALDCVETFGADAAQLLEPILDVASKEKPKVKPYYTGRFAAAIKLAKSGP